MSDVFSQDYLSQWRDMDFNQHMGNAAFLDYAANTRFLFLEAVGFTPADFAARRLGPVILEDTLRYRREIRMLEPFAVSYELSATTADGRKWRVRNTFRTADDGVCATVDSLGIWLDLDARRPVRPPADLRDAMARLTRTEDFEDWGR
jgi:acyl-CoA thioester hydrolase